MVKEFPEEGSTRFRNDDDAIAVTTVEAHNETTRDDHDVRLPHPAETHQQPSSYSQNVDHQHTLHPVKTQRENLEEVR